VEVQRHPEMKRGLRAEKIATFQEIALAQIEEFNKGVPTLRTTALKDREFALGNIRAGRPPKDKAPESGELVDPTPWLPDADMRMLQLRGQRTLTGKQDALLTELRRTNQLRMIELTPTEDLNATVSGWRLAAETTPDKFPYADYAAGDLMAAVLRQRAATGDNRATMAIQTLGGIDDALLRHAGIEGADGSSHEERELQQLKPAVEAMGRGGMEGLKAIEDALGPYLRAVDRADPAAAQLREQQYAAESTHEVIPKAKWQDMAFMSANRAKFNSGEFVRGEE